MKRLLHIGCGYSQREDTHPFFHGEDWEHVRIDLNPECKPDVVANIITLEKFGANEADAIFSSHNLEHLHLWDAQKALARWKQVLSPDGLIVLYVPDIAVAMKHALEHGLDSIVYNSPAGPITPLDMLYGHVLQTEDNVYQRHLAGYTTKFLTSLLVNAGFFSFQILERNFQLEAYIKKLNPVKATP